MLSYIPHYLVLSRILKLVSPEVLGFFFFAGFCLVVASMLDQ